MIQTVSHKKRYIYFQKKKKSDPWKTQRRTRRPTLLTMKPSIPNASAATNYLPRMKNRGRGNKIMVGTVLKAKVGELKEKVREGFSRRLRKQMTGVMQKVVGNRRYVLRL